MVKEYGQKCSNVYELINVLTIIHFNGMYLIGSIFPVQTRWPRVTKSKGIPVKGRMIPLDAAMFLWEAVEQILPFAKQLIPGLIPIAQEQKPASFVLDVMDRARKLPMLLIPKRFSKMVSYYGKHYIQRNGQGFKSEFKPFK